jgi:hypothetical protein
LAKELGLRPDAEAPEAARRKNRRVAAQKEIFQAARLSRAQPVIRPRTLPFACPFGQPEGFCQSNYRYAGGHGPEYNKCMSTPVDQNPDLLAKTADFYRRSIENYAEYTKTERKPRTKRQLEARLKVILQEIENLNKS